MHLFYCTSLQDLFELAPKMDKGNIRVIFVLPSSCPSELETSEVMQQAFETCKQNSINVNWHAEKDCLTLELNKTDFLVFQAFEGAVFEEIKKGKSVIVGPWCLLTCLTEGKQIPNFPWPIYSVAMMGCTITCSSLPKQKKRQLQDKIESMGGYFSPNLTGNCTHLVTDSVKSEKYITAAETGVKLVLTSWVEAVWKASQDANIHCNDDQFDKHRCPAFHNLVICCTGFNHSQRNALAKMVTDNGGIYREQLRVSSTDILVCDEGSSSEKHKAAKKRKIKCVTLKWATDSVEKGYAMPDNLYPVKIGTSTPTKEGEIICPDFSMISNIANESILPLKKTELTTIDMTVNMTKLGTPIKENPSVKRKSASNEHNDLVDELDIKSVKKAGPFLDGCGVFLVGFGADQRDKLCKVLNFSGATRYDDITERVTHVLIGDVSCHELRLLKTKGVLKNCALINIHWLLDSISKQHPVDETNYLVNVGGQVPNEPSSPLSKKGLHLLKTNSSIVENEVIMVEQQGAPQPINPEPEADILQQYLTPTASIPKISDQEDTLAKLLENASTFNVNDQNNLPSPRHPGEASQNSKVANSSNSKPSRPSGSLSSAVDESSQPIEPIYKGFKFVICGFTEEEQESLRCVIDAMAGKVVSQAYKGIPDYAVVPISKSELKNVATEVVTDLWITECWQENEMRPIEYFHRPCTVNEEAKPLNECVITISGYSNYERAFLKHLIIRLGGTFQEQFARITSAKANVVASTHLVSPEATGKKYAAAIKWKLPVVDKNWLFECARTSQYVSEEKFLVGDAQSASRSSTNPSSWSSNKTCEMATKLLSPAPGPSCLENSTKSFQPEANKFNFMPYKHLTQKDPDTPNNSSSNLKDGTLVQNVIAAEHNRNFETPPETTVTPENKLLRNVLNTSGVCSQVTPVSAIMAEARKRNLLGTPQEVGPRPLPWDYVKTPDTPLGAFINPDPSPNLRKQMVRFLNTLPEYRPRRNSTPLSELKRRLWDKICPPKDGERPNDPNFDSDSECAGAEKNAEVFTPPKTSPNVPVNIVNNQLQQLEEMLASSGGSKSRNPRRSVVPVQALEAKDSQPNTVAWDDCMEYDDIGRRPKVRIFMFSGIEQDQRDLFTAKLEDLGGVVSSLSSFDPIATHLICPKPMRNEKTLASIAAGKWILHTSYLEQSVKEGKLLDEELFEYGNPKSSYNIAMQGNKENESRVLAIHYWRNEISRRGYGPFHDMRAIVVTPKKESIVRIIEAGGGTVINARPPFTEPLHATHCLIELKHVNNLPDYIPLAKQGIYCLNILYISDVLQKTASDISDFIVPAFAEYYKGSYMM